MTHYEERNLKIITEAYKTVNPIVIFAVEHGQLEYFDRLLDELRQYPCFIDSSAENDNFKNKSKIKVYSITTASSKYMDLNYNPLLKDRMGFKKTEMHPEISSAQITYHLGQYLGPLTSYIPEGQRNLLTPADYSIAPVKYFGVIIDKTGLEIYHANKMKHIRAVSPLSIEQAEHFRQSGNTNVMVISALYQPDTKLMAKTIHKFVNTEFLINDQRAGIIKSAYDQK